MNNLSYEEYKEKVKDNLVTDEAIFQLENMFPDKLVESDEEIITGFRLYMNLKDRMLLKAANEDWSWVMKLTKKLNDFDKDNLWHYFYEGDSVYDKPLKMKDILK